MSDQPGWVYGERVQETWREIGPDEQVPLRCHSCHQIVMIDQGENVEAVCPCGQGFFNVASLRVFKMPDTPGWAIFDSSPPSEPFYIDDLAEDPMQLPGPS